MLNHERDRHPLRRRTVAWAALAVFAVVIPLTAASIAPAAAPNGAAVSHANDVALAAQPARPVAAQPADRSRNPHAVEVQPASYGATCPTGDRATRPSSGGASTGPAATCRGSNGSNGCGGACGDRRRPSGAVNDFGHGHGPVRRRATRCAHEPQRPEHDTRSTVTDDSRRFAFRDLLPARYDLLASLPGSPPSRTRCRLRRTTSSG